MSDAETTLKPSECSLRGLSFYFLRLGATGFGGPIALVGYMQRDLVEQRGWITNEQYLRGLALAQLAPGPLAAQLAIYIGYLRGKTLGATLIGIAFILPSFLMVVALGMLYVALGGLQWIQALFYGVGAAVIGVITKSDYKLTRLTLKDKKLLWVIFSVMGVVTAYTEQEVIWLFLLSGVLALVMYAPPKFISSSTQGLISPVTLSLIQLPNAAQTGTLIKILLFFAKAGAFVFGSGLAIVPFLYGGIVQEHHWLNERQFLDAVAVAMITPGPVVITVGFIGYLIAGLPGAILAALGVFLPVYLFVVVPAPYVERYAKNPQLIAFVDGVTAAATGAIAGAVIVLGRKSITDIPTAAIALVTVAVLIRFRIPEPVIMVIAGILGLLLFPHHI